MPIHAGPAMGSDHPLSPPPPSTPHSYPPMIIVLTIVFLVFLFVGFFSIYCCRCFMQNILCTWHVRHNPTGTPVGGAVSSAPRVGLDPLLVQSFPSFTYSTVKDYRKEKYGLECAICLLEFKGSDVLRLLPICCHVFHQECVDLWLESHDTCPVCRRNLTSPPHSPSKSLESERIEDSVSITIKDESEDEASEKGKGICCDSGKQVDIVDKFSRSHSTGHSIPRDNDNEEDRFTLRLPEDVKSRIIKGLNSSKSWSTFGEYKETNVGVSEVTEVSGRDDKVKTSSFSLSGHRQQIWESYIPNPVETWVLIGTDVAYEAMVWQWTLIVLESAELTSSSAIESSGQSTSRLPALLCHTLKTLQTIPVKEILQLV